jgi:hypothetical protein
MPHWGPGSVSPAARATGSNSAVATTMTEPRSEVTLAVDQLPVLAARVSAKICHASKLFETSDNVM